MLAALAAWSGDKLERFAAGGPDNSEVSAIEGRHAGLAESLCDRDDAGMCAAERQISARSHESLDTSPVRGVEVFDFECPIEDRLVERRFNCGAEFTLDQV